MNPTITLDSEYSFTHTVTEEEVNTFAKLSGDTNALHTNDSFAKTTRFGERVVHGMFLGALCSKLVGMYLPGGNCLYLKQTLHFKNPCHINDTITVHGKVTAKSESTRVLTIMITISRDDTVLMQGEGYVQQLEA